MINKIKTIDALCELTISHSQCDCLEYLCLKVSISILMFVTEPDFTGTISYILF
jgi:hypothetical protein